MEYKKGLGILVNIYTKDDLIKKLDKEEIEHAKEKYKLGYINSIYKNNKLYVYLCNFEDCKDLHSGTIQFT